MARNDALDITNEGLVRLYKESKTITFDGGTANDIGDYDGTGNPSTQFNVTGMVAARAFARITDDLTGATATIELGLTGNTAAMIAQATATDLDDGEIYTDSGPSTAEALPGYKLINGQDIILTVGTANITAGTMEIVVEFYPISDDGDVRAA